MPPETMPLLDIYVEKRGSTRRNSNCWRQIIAFALLTLGVVGRTDQRSAWADDAANVILTPATSDQPVSVRDRLIAGLQARLPSEVAFIDQILLAVQMGHLPQRMVDETFFWARQKAADPAHGRPRRPIIYFQPAMVARANALHVTL
jgi:hypothetical protein